MLQIVEYSIYDIVVFLKKAPITSSFALGEHLVSRLARTSKSFAGYTTPLTYSGIQLDLEPCLRGRGTSSSGPNVTGRNSWGNQEQISPPKPVAGVAGQWQLLNRAITMRRS